VSRRSLATTFRFLLSCCILAAGINALAAPRVTTVAGGYIGDGKPATSASLAGPNAVASDVAGNIYIADQSNCRIRMINTKGVISTFAGTGICGYSGDGGPATSAMILYPVGLAFDTQGSLLFCDPENQRIRKVTSTGIITTIAGNGAWGYSGDGGPATQASISDPADISVDPLGNVYIADSENSVIRMVDATGIIHTVAGNHTYGSGGDGGPAVSAQLGDPQGVRTDNNGNFYIADGGTGRVRKVDSSGIITTYAGNGSSGNTGSGGPATSASIGYPRGLLVGSGKLYINTDGNIWTVDSATQVINLVAGDPSGYGGFNGDGANAVSTKFTYLKGMGFDSAGDLLVADSGNDRIRKIDAGQIVTTIAGGYIGDGGLGTSASLHMGRFDHIGFDPAGNLYIADSFNCRVRRVSPTGVITTFAGTGISGNTGDGGPAASATLGFPEAVVADRNGNIFIADEGYQVIRKVDSTGTITTFSNAIIPFQGGAMAIDLNNDLYLADGLWTVWKIAPSGSASIVAGEHFQNGFNGDGLAATGALLNAPSGIAFDAAGDLLIADTGNNRIRKVNTSGIISTVAGTGVSGFSGDGRRATLAQLFEPADVAVDAKGNFYVSDQFNGRVRVVNRFGRIHTFAGTGNGTYTGTGTGGYNGDGLAATATNLYPIGVAVSPKGVVHVVDGESQRVRKIH
jgi:sugar lactone lactonase YvrE